MLSEWTMNTEYMQSEQCVNSEPNRSTYIVGLCIGQVFSIRYVKLRYPIYWMYNLFKHFRWKRSKTSENSHGTLVINRFRHMCGAFGWLGDKFIMSLVMDSDICFPTGCCNLLEHKLHSAALYSLFAEYSHILHTAYWTQNVFAFC